jgi:hypothetical protein
VELAKYVASRVEELDLKKLAKPAAAKPELAPAEPPAFAPFVYGMLGALAVVGVAALAMRGKKS